MPKLATLKIQQAKKELSKSDGLGPRYKQPCGVGVHVDISTQRQEGVKVELCFSINFENCCAHLAANFLNFPNIPNFLHLDGFEESYGQKIKKNVNQKNVNLSKS